MLVSFPLQTTTRSTLSQQPEGTHLRNCSDQFIFISTSCERSIGAQLRKLMERDRSNCCTAMLVSFPSQTTTRSTISQQLDCVHLRNSSARFTYISTSCQRSISAELCKSMERDRNNCLNAMLVSFPLQTTTRSMIFQQPEFTRLRN